ncbi:MAG: hypothetical protein LCH92_08255 [Proteobacteria bacterium]|nr:hypothetical protein [Pseudomonadota bacterium]
MSGKRGKQITIAEFRRLWDDMSITQTEIGAMLGITEQAVNLRAKKRGFPPRGYPRKRMSKPVDRDLFAAMWAAGVGNQDIADHFAVSYFSVRHYRDRFGLQSRGRCGKFPAISIKAFWEGRMAKAMRVQAETERAKAAKRAKREAAWMRSAA